MWSKSTRHLRTLKALLTALLALLTAWRQSHLRLWLVGRRPHNIGCFCWRQKPSSVGRCWKYHLVHGVIDPGRLHNSRFKLLESNSNMVQQSSPGFQYFTNFTMTISPTRLTQTIRPRAFYALARPSHVALLDQRDSMRNGDVLEQALGHGNARAFWHLRLQNHWNQETTWPWTHSQQYQIYMCVCLQFFKCFILNIFVFSFTLSLLPGCCGPVGSCRIGIGGGAAVPKPPDQAMASVRLNRTAAGGLQSSALESDQPIASESVWILCQKFSLAPFLQRRCLSIEDIEVSLQNGQAWKVIAKAAKAA